MRTTVDIDQDLLDRLRKQADRQGSSFRDELNRAIRRGLAPVMAAAIEPFVMPTFALGIRPEIPLGKLQAWLDDQDDDERLQKLREREKTT